MTATRKWVPIVAGVAVLLVFVAIGAVVVSMSWMQEHLAVTTATQTDATHAFDEARAKFPGVPPLLDLQDGKPRYNDHRAGRTPSPTSLTVLHVLAFDPGEDKLARFELPFWLLRLKSGPIRISSYAGGFDDRGVRLTVEDIERHGPGIVLDFARPRGERVLIWAE